MSGNRPRLRSIAIALVGLGLQARQRRALGFIASCVVLSLAVGVAVASHFDLVWMSRELTPKKVDRHAMIVAFPRLAAPSLFAAPPLHKRDFDRVVYPMRIERNGVPLGERAKTHSQVREEGGGLWFYQDNYVLYSSPDATDPRVSGDRYVAFFPVRVAWLPMAAVAGLLATLVVRRLTGRLASGAVLGAYRMG